MALNSRYFFSGVENYAGVLRRESPLMAVPGQKHAAWHVAALKGSYFVTPSADATPKPPVGAKQT
jgi:hypothetical protein